MDEKGLNISRENKGTRERKDLKGKEREGLMRLQDPKCFETYCSLGPMIEPLINLRTVFPTNKILNHSQCHVLWTLLEVETNHLSHPS